MAGSMPGGMEAAREPGTVSAGAERVAGGCEEGPGLPWRRAIARSKVPVVAAVSCDPATLARDLRTLTDGGYALKRVTPIDQFLWSPRIEAVAVLRRR